jgi:hypothetical protein
MATGVDIIKHIAEHTGYKNYHTRNTDRKILQKKEIMREMRHEYPSHTTGTLHNLSLIY